MAELGGSKSLRVTSKAFKHGERIPDKHTCKGDDVCPPLFIEGVAPSAKALAIIVDDPDAPRGTWVHWTAWNIDPTATKIGEGADPSSLGGREGATDNRSIGYGGPCPPPGKPHRYFFKVYALNKQLDTHSGASIKDLEKDMTGKVLAWGELMGTYSR